jgi:hypothetical protein
MKLNEKCKNCNHCEPYGIGISSEHECMKYHEYCDTAVQYCKEK